jgi:hypothetical protein
MKRLKGDAADSRRPSKEQKRDAGHTRYSVSACEVSLRETFDALGSAMAELPPSDNAEGAVEKMLRANAILRQLPWPSPFDETCHRVRCGDARDMPWLAEESVHLVVTSPPYWTLKHYEPHDDQQRGDAPLDAILLG